MKDILTKKLHDYLLQNNPDILFDLQKDGKVREYIEAKMEIINDLLLSLLEEKRPTYIIEEICMNELTEEYRPSKYNYILSVLEETFPKQYSQLFDQGILVYEAVNIVQKSNPVFEINGFSEENEDDASLRGDILKIVSRHFNEDFIDSEYLDKIDFNSAL